MLGLRIVNFAAGTIKCWAWELLIFWGYNKILGPENVDFAAGTIKLWAWKMLILWLKQ